jgi:hypothetical protein
MLFFTFQLTSLPFACCRLPFACCLLPFALFAIIPIALYLTSLKNNKNDLYIKNKYF